MENEGSCNIADAMNTYNTALNVIKSKGFRLFVYPDAREDYFGDFYAIKGKRKLIASDPLRLLGLISMWESTGDNWQYSSYSDDVDVYDYLLSRAYPDTVEDLNKLTESDYQKLITDYQFFFKECYLSVAIDSTTSRAKMFEVLNTFYKEKDE